MSTDTVSADARSPTASAQPDFTFAVHDPLAAVPLRLHVNGADHHASVEPWTTLLDALRERAGLTGTKKGCDHGACGACTVMIDGRRVLSCLTLALSARNGAIVTIEGLAPGDGTLHPMQQAFVDHDALQCGYCTPGQVYFALSSFIEDQRQDCGGIDQQGVGQWPVEGGVGRARQPIRCGTSPVGSTSMKARSANG